MKMTMRMLGIAGALSLSTAAMASAQEPVVRPQPLQADTTCMKWKAGTTDSTPTNRKAMPADTIADRRYRECQNRSDRSMTSRDTVSMRMPDSSKAPGTMPRKP